MLFMGLCWSFGGYAHEIVNAYRESACMPVTYVFCVLVWKTITSPGSVTHPIRTHASILYR